MPLTREDISAIAQGVGAVLKEVLAEFKLEQEKRSATINDRISAVEEMVTEPKGE
jgi:hypothetical protein